MRPSDFTIGQRIFVVYSLNRRTPELHDAIVTKVGRRWVSFGRDDASWQDRFDAEDMAIDGGEYPSPGRAYLSRAVYEAETRRAELWKALRQAIGDERSAPAWLSTADIEAFLTALLREAQK